MHGRNPALLAAVIVGLAVGALSALSQAHLEGTLNALVNSTSTWLVAPFLIGALAVTRRGAAAAGFATCAFQLGGYYLVAHLRGIGTTGSLVAFWTACAVAGGPVFGAAGHQWRTASPQLKGLGSAVLAGVFIAEGLYTYAHEQHHYVTGALWIAVGLAVAVLAGRGRSDHLRWLGVTVPLGLAGEAALTEVLHRFL
jgi:hypothetical protein